MKFYNDKFVELINTRPLHPHTKDVVEAVNKGYEIKKKNLNIVISNIETVLFHKNTIIEVIKYIPVEKKI